MSEIINGANMNKSGVYPGWKPMAAVDEAIAREHVDLIDLNATANDTYTPAAGKAYKKVTVNVPQTTLTSLSVTENGVYTPETGSAYNSVNVNVPPVNELTYGDLLLAIESLPFANGYVQSWAYYDDFMPFSDSVSYTIDDEDPILLPVVHDDDNSITYIGAPYSNGAVDFSEYPVRYIIQGTGAGDLYIDDDSPTSTHDIAFTMVRNIKIANVTLRSNTQGEVMINLNGQAFKYMLVDIVGGATGTAAEVKVPVISPYTVLYIGNNVPVEQCTGDITYDADNSRLLISGDGTVFFSNNA